MALAITATVAVHYRAEAARLQHGSPPAVSLPAAPEVTSVALQLLAGDGVSGAVVITAAGQGGAVSGWPGPVCSIITESVWFKWPTIT